MTANRLRLGNWVNYQLMNHECKVRGIGYDCLWLNGTEYGGPVGIELFKPIPLTEDWLIKFLLDKEDIKILEGYLDDYIDGRSVDGLKYVHQLQNLYFALTGEELTIKDK